MKLNERIRALRRERGMTQEQLAEAMDVSSAAVSKWENGQSVPDVAMLIELADYFEVSLDALIGFAPRSHRREDMVSRVKELSIQRSEEVVPAVREAMRRYPNHFDVVWASAKAIGFRGMEKHDEGNLREALALMDQALLLLPQNTDPEIRRESILCEKGLYHTALGEYDKAIDYYRQGNVGGINSVAIGNCYVAMHQYDKALSPLSRGMMFHLSSLYNAIYGLFMTRAEMGHEDEAVEIARWCGGMLAGLDATPGSYVWKLRSIMLVCAAVMSSAQGKEQEARAALEEAIDYARRFDAAPNFNASSVRFYYGEEKSLSDDTGESAMDALEQAVQSSGDERLQGLLHDLMKS